MATVFIQYDESWRFKEAAPPSTQPRESGAPLRRLPPLVGIASHHPLNARAPRARASLNSAEGLSGPPAASKPLDHKLSRSAVGPRGDLCSANAPARLLAERFKTGGPTADGQSRIRWMSRLWILVPAAVLVALGLP